MRQLTEFERLRLKNSLGRISTHGKMAAERQTEAAKFAALGCRYQHPGSGCRCGAAVFGNSAFCENHQDGTPDAMPGHPTTMLFQRRS